MTRALVWLLGGLAVVLVAGLTLVVDRALEYRKSVWQSEGDFANEGLRLTSNEAIRSARVRPLGVFVGGSLVRYWFLPADLPIPLVNRGGLEERIEVTRDRFSDTVLAAGADIVVVNGGFCDLQRRVRSEKGGEEAAAGRVFAAVQEIVNLARRHGVRPVLSTLTPVRPRLTLRSAPWLDLGSRPRAREKEAVRRLNDLLRAYARQEHIPLIDFFSIVADEKGELRRSFSARDGEHLNAAGYEVLDDVLRVALTGMGDR